MLWKHLHQNETINNRQIVHYGGENEIDVLRNGTLYFYNNTVISSRTDATTLFRLSSERQHADVRNNIFYVNSHPGDQLELVTPESPGSIDLSHNWFSAGWVDSIGGSDARYQRRWHAIVGNRPRVY